MKLSKHLMKNTSDPKHEEYAREVKRFEAVYGEDWDGTMVEYDNDYVSLPLYVFKAAGNGNLRAVLHWLGSNIKDRVNAKCEEGGSAGLLFTAALYNQHDFMSYLLMNGADVNIIGSIGASVLSVTCGGYVRSVVSSDDHNDSSKTIRLLLSWGAELFEEGKQLTKQEKLDVCGVLSRNKNAAIAKLMSSELGGRRCEIVSTTNTRSDLIGKTCVVAKYIKESNQYKVTMEFTNEVLLLGATSLKRRDRTPQDPGYYVKCNNNRLVRRDFKSNEECQAFITNLSAHEEESAEVDPDAEAKAEQAAADLLAELGLEDLEDPSSNVSKKDKQSMPAGKKKKRGGKKKGRK